MPRSRAGRIGRLEALLGARRHCPAHEVTIAVRDAEGRGRADESPRPCAGCGRPAEVLTVRLRTVPDRSGPRGA